jgi:hypothetical protein
MDATNPARAEYIDLWDLADEASSLVPMRANQLKNAVATAVVHERHASGGVTVSGQTFQWDHSGVHGLSIYYPPTQSSGAFDRYGSQYQMSLDGTWDEFLAWALPEGFGRGMAAFRFENKFLGGDTFIYTFVYLPLMVR